MKNENLVEVLVATYNGKCFIEELIRSILNQTWKQLHILVRDDGSTDGTLAIIQKLVDENRGKITLIQDNQPNLGVIQNFAELIRLSTAPYIFLSDQDDFWLPNKVELCLQCLKKAEKKWGKETPLLVHSDLKVVDHELNEIHPSFWQFAHLNPQNGSLNRLLVQNYMAGCTMGINRSLAQMIPHIPKGVMMHDWWIGLVASAFGKIVYLKEPTILYRQHQGNTLGAQKFDWKRIFTVFFKEKNVLNDKPREQAIHFLRIYGDSLDSNLRELVEGFIAIKRENFWKQRYLLLKYGFYKHGFLRNIRTILRPFKY